MKAAVAFALLVVAPIAVFPGGWAFFFVLAIGLPATLWLLPREKPSRLHPSIFSEDPAEHDRRFEEAMARWRVGRS